jgi:urea carboxylase
VRVYAEDPERDFRPSAGTLTAAAFAPESRVETWVDAGTEVTPFYDPLLAKIVAWGETRSAANARLAAALRDTELAGVQTNLDYLRGVLAWPLFQEHAHHTRSLETFAFRSRAVDVLAPGDLTTVQDHPGRLGYWDVGVPPSGPMDARSFRRGNVILGNVAGAAGLEMTLRGPTLRFRSEALVCLAGAPIDAASDDGTVPMWRPVALPAGTTLTLGTIRGPGARTYLLVRGGIAVPPYLGSRATFTLGGFGGHCGRALRADDVLPLGSPDDPAVAPDAPLDATRAAALSSAFPRDWTLRVMAGPHGSPEFFTEDDIARFHAEPFEVHYQSARTGVRLIGPKPGWARTDGGEAGLHPSNIHDTAYSVGAVDYTGDMPVILGPDGPSLGGFTCPAVVVEADRWKLGQLTAGDRVRFEEISVSAARDLAAAEERTIATRTSATPPPPPAPRTAADPADGVLDRRAARPPVPAVTYRQSGDCDVLVEYGPMRLDIDLRVRVQLLYEALRARVADGAWRGIVDLTPGVRSLQIHYDPATLDRRRLLDDLAAVEDALPSGAGVSLPTRIVRLPLSWDDPAVQEAIRKYMRVVRDDAPWCPSNIEFIRRVNGLESEAEVRRIVFDASYLVLGLGDVYLGAPVATPVDPRHRLVTTKYNPARTWTPENAVGIGGAYLCVYGMEGPGGYQFVGRTVPVWNTHRKWKTDTPWLLRFFDQIRFFPVSAAELLDYRRGVRDGSIEIEAEAGVFDVGAHHRFLDAIADSAEAFARRQRAAFDAERQRWRDAGEFDAAKRAEADLGSRRREAADAAEVPAGCIPVTAPLGAQVWRVSVAPGDDVEAGGELCVLAAMKMETTVAAPEAGRVEAVFVAEGEVLAAGTLLAAIRPEAARAR